MAVKRITKRTVDALAPSSKEQFVWDDDLSGFGLKMSPSGRKSYVLQYRLPNVGRSAYAKRLTLGIHGRLTPDEARGLAKRELARVAQGNDPAADRAKRRDAPTVEAVGVAYFAEVAIRNKLRTAREYARLWRKHVLPALGSRPVGEVNSVEIRRLHRSLHTRKYVANRVLSLVGAFFRFAAEEGHGSGSSNPCAGITPYPEEGRERFLTPQEYARLGDSLTRAERTGLLPAPTHRRRPKGPHTAKHTPANARKPIPANPLAVAAIRLLALTGCREGEVLSLRWDAVDFDRGFLRLEGTKTGRSVRPLSAEAAALLQSVRPLTDGSTFVFPGGKQGHHLTELKRLWHAVRHSAELPGVRLHDLRHSLASTSASDGESLLVIQHLLGHSRATTTERYAHLSADPVRRAANRAGQSISRWMGGSALPEEAEHAISKRGSAPRVRVR